MKTQRFELQITKLEKAGIDGDKVHVYLGDWGRGSHIVWLTLDSDEAAGLALNDAMEVCVEYKAAEYTPSPSWRPIKKAVQP